MLDAANAETNSHGCLEVGRGAARVEIPIVVDPEDSARAAGLVHSGDDAPGYTRKRAGKGFSYVDAAGHVVKDAGELARIRHLAIPPAWTDVWIAKSARGHIQATGRDARGRKQYRYHERWREVRDETKFHRMIAFGHVLPSVRDRARAHLAEKGLSRDKVLATVVTLLETTLVRVGNDEYARQNESYGLTTLRDEHVEIKGDDLRFHFRGKSGKVHGIALHDKRMAKIIRRLTELPGKELFQYVDAEGNRHGVHSEDVNAYLHVVAGEEFTAKDFRTWAGTSLAARELVDLGAFESATEAKRRINEALDRVASRLGNTRAVCRKSYVHPAVIESYLAATLVEELERAAPPDIEARIATLREEEAKIMRLLHARIAALAPAPRAKATRKRGRAAEARAVAPRSASAAKRPARGRGERAKATKK